MLFWAQKCLTYQISIEINQIITYRHSNMGSLCSFSELILFGSYAKTLYRDSVNDCTLEAREQNFDRLVKIETALLVNMVAYKFVNCVANLVGAKNNKIHKCKKCMGQHGYISSLNIAEHVWQALKVLR